MLDNSLRVSRKIMRARRNPRFYRFYHVFKALARNRMALAGLVMTAFFFLFTILDYAYPAYLGVTPANYSLRNAISSFGGTYTSGFYSYPGYPTLANGWYGWFGYTNYNLPIFPVMLAALKWDVSYTLFIVLISALIGTVVGLISGFYGKYTDESLMRLSDIFMTVPFLVFAIGIAYVLGGGLLYLMTAFVIVWWPVYAKVVRKQSRDIRSKKFLSSAAASGSPRIKTVFSHILPNVLPPVIVQIFLDLGIVIQIFAAVQFLGLGIVSKNLPDIGNMISWGFHPQYFSHGIWWPVVVPGIFIVLFSVSVYLLGDGLREVLKSGSEVTY